MADAEDGDVEIEQTNNKADAKTSKQLDSLTNYHEETLVDEKKAQDVSR
jgi:hypothetical protein